MHIIGHNSGNGLGEETMDDNDSKFEEIGELLLQVINYIEENYKKAAQKQAKTDVHYLKQLTRELSPAVKAGWKLRKKLMRHPQIKNSISVEMINAELLSRFGTKSEREKIRKMNPKKIGQNIIKSLVEQRSPKLVTFPLQGLLPRAEFKTISNTDLGILVNILKKHKIPLVSISKDNNQYSNKQIDLYGDASKYEQENLNTYFVGTKVIASDRKAAVRLAEQQLNLVLNIIRLLIPLDYALFNRPRISFYDLPGIDEAFIISPISGKRELFRQFKSSPYPFIPSISRYNVKKSIDTANEMACKNESERSDLENRIISAINWAGEGIDTIEKDIKVVKCVIALEVLFRLKNIGKQKQFVEEVGRIFDFIDMNREFVKTRAEKIYELRSKIVHRGKRDIADEEAEWAERIACGCILRTLEKHGN